MIRYLEIAKENLRHNMPLHVVIAAGLLLLSPLLIGNANLGAADTAKVLEMYVALIGVLLLPPVFLPEQNKDIRDLVYSKYVKASSVYLVRIAEAVFVLSVLLGMYIWMLYVNDCRMEIWKYFFGTLSQMLFMGGLGIFFYGCFDSIVIGYLIPIFYYIAAVGSGEKYLKSFYPFSMMKGSYDEKIYLAGGAVMLIAAGIMFRGRRK